LAASIDVRSESLVSPVSPDVLTVENLQAGYRNRTVVFGVDLHVAEGEAITILGHNGAGKTTTLKAICGLLTPSSGCVTYHGEDVSHVPCHRKVAKGMVFIPSEQFTFSTLSVIDNLRLGARPEKARRVRDECLERVYGLFPILAERSDQLAGTLSGGEQRMLAIGIALMSNPTLLLLDEPSLGLAPTLAQEIMQVVKQLVNAGGLSAVVVEQHIGLGLEIADRVYIMRAGHMILEENAAAMAKRERLWDLF
jgi:branched-chain amino acid transport system ATP-binding protein